MIEDDDWSRFSTDLSTALRAHSARALAAKAHWGKTTVAQIKSGQRPPSRRQLDDLLLAARVGDVDRAAWLARFDAVAAREHVEDALSPEPGPVVEGEVGGSPEKPLPEMLSDATRQGAARARFPRSVFILGGGVFAAVLAVVVGLAWRGSAAGPVGTPSTDAPPTFSAAPPSTLFATIETPLDDASVGSKAGVVLKGKQGLLGGATLWLVDRDSDGTYTADTAADLTGPDTWSAEDAPVGDPDELPQALTVLLVAADDRCATLLRREVDADDSDFDVLPDGCVVLDQVRVNIDRP